MRTHIDENTEAAAQHFWCITTAETGEVSSAVLSPICKRLRSLGVDSKESIPQSYVAWRDDK